MFILLFFKRDHSQYNWSLGKCRDIVMQIIRYWSLTSLGGGFVRDVILTSFWQKRIFDPYLNMAYTMQVVNCPSASRDEQKHVQTVQYMIKSPTQKISRPCKL